MELVGRRKTNKNLEQVRSLDRIRSLTIANTSIDDKGLGLLATAERLEELHISSQLMTDTSMSVFCELPRLRSLFLDDVPNVTDAGIANIKKLNNLIELLLRGTQLSNEGLDSILHLSNLSVLETVRK